MTPGEEHGPFTIVHYHNVPAKMWNRVMFSLILALFITQLYGLDSVHEIIQLLY